jgi:polysaccharide deacetylase family protein (PEP-CTERM system associated)
MLNALTIDVEDYFHPSEVQERLGSRDWSTFTPRLESTMRRVLELLQKHNVRATCFILGWVAERFPALVRAISAAGHEIACHSYAHQLVFRMSREAFRCDTERGKKAIEDACGVSPKAFRAPSFSITSQSMWALDVLLELEFTVDSSIYPVAHDRYGIPGFSRHASVVRRDCGTILEIPPATVQLSDSQVSPVGGGAYLRLLPYRYTAAGIRQVNAQEGRPVCIYFHPWEVDPGQPRLIRGLLPRLRTYGGLAGMERKLARLLREFQFSTISSVYGNG